MSSWEAIERIAREQLGVEAETLRKWRVRGVPLSRRLDIVNADTGHEVDQRDFDNPPGPRYGAPGRPACAPEEAA